MDLGAAAGGEDVEAPQVVGPGGGDTVAVPEGGDLAGRQKGCFREISKEAA